MKLIRAFVVFAVALGLALMVTPIATADPGMPVTCLWPAADDSDIHIPFRDEVYEVMDDLQEAAGADPYLRTVEEFPARDPNAYKAAYAYRCGFHDNTILVVSDRHRNAQVFVGSFFRPILPALQPSIDQFLTREKEWGAGDYVKLFEDFTYVVQHDPDFRKYSD